MRKFKIAGWVLLNIFVLNWSLLSAPEKKEEELARVGLVPFEDRTGSKNYAYLSESLTDAINESLQKNFTYEKISYDDIKKAIFNSQQIIIKKKGSLTAITDPRKEEEWKEIVKEISSEKNLHADVLIYGNYRFDEVNNEIIFVVNLYLGLINTTVVLDEIHNPVDGTIFKATEKVARNIVWEINNMVDKAAKQEPQEAAETPVEKKPGEKKVITRSVVQGPYSWDSKKLAIGGFIGLIGFASDGTNEHLDIPIIETYIRIWPVPSLQLTLAGATYVGFANGQPSYSRGSLSLLGGYSGSFQAFHWFIEAGPSFNIVAPLNPAATEQTLIGPEIRTGVDLLVSESYAFGVKAGAQLLFGAANPAFALDGSITASIVF